MLFSSLRTNSKWPPKMVGKRVLEQVAVHLADTLWVKISSKITLSRTVSEINAFCVLRRNSRWPHTMTEKRVLEKRG